MKFELIRNRNTYFSDVIILMYYFHIVRYLGSLERYIPLLKLHAPMRIQLYLYQLQVVRFAA